MVLGENIKKLRKKNNMTQQQLADKICVTRPFITDIENDKKSPSLQNLVSIADVLGCTTDDLLKEKEKNAI